MLGNVSLWEGIWYGYSYVRAAAQSEDNDKIFMVSNVKLRL